MSSTPLKISNTSLAKVNLDDVKAPIDQGKIDAFLAGENNSIAVGTTVINKESYADKAALAKKLDISVAGLDVLIQEAAKQANGQTNVSLDVDPESAKKMGMTVGVKSDADAFVAKYPHCAPPAREQLHPALEPLVAFSEKVQAEACAEFTDQAAPDAERAKEALRQIALERIRSAR